MKPLIAVSLYSADYSNLIKEIKRFEKAKINLLHFDVMDGNYVPNLTIGLPIVKALKGKTRLKFDVHLMINKPDFFIPKFLELKPKMISFHLETTRNPLKLLKLIRKNKVKAGLAVNANVSIKKVFPFLKYCDFVLVMSVQAGFGGQKFQLKALKKIKALVKERKKRKLNFLIEVDGGINNKTACLALNAGAEILVSGSFLVKSKNLKKSVNSLRCLND